MLEICEDVKEECDKYGEVIEMKVPRPSGGSRQSNGVGKIYVKYDTPDSAKKALQALAGRKFADRTVVTTYFSEVNPFTATPIKALSILRFHRNRSRLMHGKAFYQLSSCMRKDHGPKNKMSVGVSQNVVSKSMSPYKAQLVHDPTEANDYLFASEGEKVNDVENWPFPPAIELGVTSTQRSWHC